MSDTDVKTKKPRKARVDSKEGVAAAIVAGGKKITVPADMTLTAYERKVFTELTEEFSKSELTAHKIRLLVTLAKQIVMLEREQVTLASEGFSLTNSHGNAVPNPRARACPTWSTSILAMRRSLGIHTRAQAGGDNREAAKRRAINKGNEGARAAYDDNLIAFPGGPGDDDDGS
ncbi:hypothetical protein GRI43_13650 [Altererythrobacter luteolus]|uniref:Terminase small subunit n=1 Tax=Pontixanthobacter luteolus TaxID=295089 RepID=A0A6I4V3F0_9SPHN|nr:hypothetical protein [Pontixanthobacter luteolus]MXP48433.1 hypothetical protein [Pontixanthobacter luteolus]